MAYQWVDCDRHTVAKRYDRVAKLIPFFEWLLFLPRDLRRQAAEHLELNLGESVLVIGCGTGRGFGDLQDAVGPTGTIYGIDISSGMLAEAQSLCDANDWHNVKLSKCDAAEYTSTVPLDGILFSLSYNTMPHHRAVLRNAWKQLRPGGSLVIMDAKVPTGPSAKFVLPFSLWLMKHTLLGNPLIHPWQELAEVAEQIEMTESLFGSYYICRAIKPWGRAYSMGGAMDDGAQVEHRIAAE